VKLSNVVALIQGMNVSDIDINFHHHELPPLEMRKKNYAFMIIAKFNRKGIKKTLIDNGSTLNVCSVSLLDRIDLDKVGIQLDSLSI
jgi:hypothetical protein